MAIGLTFPTDRNLLVAVAPRPTRLRAEVLVLSLLARTRGDRAALDLGPVAVLERLDRRGLACPLLAAPRDGTARLLVELFAARTVAGRDSTVTPTDRRISNVKSTLRVMTSSNTMVKVRLTANDNCGRLWASSVDLLMVLVECMLTRLDNVCPLWAVRCRLSRVSRGGRLVG